MRLNVPTLSESLCVCVCVKALLKITDRSAVRGTEEAFIIYLPLYMCNSVICAWLTEISGEDK